MVPHLYRELTHELTHEGKGSGVTPIGPEGFEPSLPDPKSGVLPLDEGPASDAAEDSARGIALAGSGGGVAPPGLITRSARHQGRALAFMTRDRRLCHLVSHRTAWVAPVEVAAEPAT